MIETYAYGTSEGLDPRDDQRNDERWWSNKRRNKRI